MAAKVRGAASRLLAVNWAADKWGAVVGLMMSRPPRAIFPVVLARMARVRLDNGGLKDRERWPEIQEAMVEAMQRLHKAFSQHLRQR